jgi:tetratricopeptide (TPR) repeat protein
MAAEIAHQVNIHEHPVPAVIKQPKRSFVFSLKGDDRAEWIASNLQNVPLSIRLRLEKQLGKRFDSLSIPSDRLLEEILEDLGDWNYENSDYEGARECFDLAMALSDQFSRDRIQNEHMCARVCRKLATVAKRQGQYDTIRQFSTKGIKFVKNQAQHAEEVRCQLLLAYCDCHDGNSAKAFQRFRGLLAKAKRLKDLELRAEVLDATSAAYIYQGNRKKATEYMRKSLPLHQDFGDTRHIADLVNNIGILYAQEYRFRGAKKYFLESQKLYQSINYTIGEANSFNNLGILQYNRGMYVAAKKQYNIGYNKHNEVGNIRGMIQCQINLAESHIALTENSAALAQLQLADMAIVSNGCQIYLPHLKRLFGEVFFQQGDFDKSMDYLNEAKKLAGECNDRVEQAQSLCLVGNIFYKQKSYEQAFHNYRASLSILRAQDEHLPLARTMFRLGLALIEQYVDVIRGKYFLEEAVKLYGTIDNKHEKLKVIDVLNTYRSTIAQCENEAD